MPTLNLDHLRTVGENHAHRSWQAAARRAREQRTLTYFSLGDCLGWAWAQDHFSAPVTITLTRIAPRPLDTGDGLPSALKHIRDGVADFLTGKPRQGHRYDDAPRFTWCYAQRRGAPRFYGVEITLEESPHAPEFPS